MMEKTALDKKINDTFPGLVVRKDLVKSVRSNAPVPGYVLEYLLGMYCATDDEATIAEGIEQVKEILRGIQCRGNTSCPDQLSKAIEAYEAQM